MLTEAIRRMPPCVPRPPNPAIDVSIISNRVRLVGSILELVADYSLDPELFRMAVGKLKEAP